MKILVAEPVHFGAVHIQVNSAFVALLRQVYAGAELEVYAEEEHIRIMQEHAAPYLESVHFTGFPAYNKSEGPGYWFRKITGEWGRILSVLLRARRQKPELLVWLCLFPTGQWWVQVLSRLFFRKQRQLVILHGEMEYCRPGQQKKTDRILGLVLKSAFRMAPPAMQFIALGHTVREHIAQLNLIKPQQLAALTHPFLYPELPKPHPAYTTPLRVGIFGALTKAKNAHLFFELAALCAREIREGLLCFYTVGKIFPEVAAYRNEWINTICSDKYVPKENFEAALNELDICTFFYDRDMYRYTASGAIHEAIALGLPVLGLDNTYLRSVTDDYELGMYFNDVYEMAAWLRELSASSAFGQLTSFREKAIMYCRENSVALQSENLRQILCR